MIPIPPQLIIAVVSGFLFLAALGGAFYKGKSVEREEWEQKAKDSQIEALKTEAAWKSAMAELQKEHEREKGAIRLRLNTDLEWLRNRPAVRLPEAARSSCIGVTGAELSGPDATAFTRLGADCERVRSDLSACIQYIQVVTKKK